MLLALRISVTMREIRAIRRGRVASRANTGAATPSPYRARWDRSGDLTATETSRLASACKHASCDPPRAKRLGGSSENRPPEALRVGLGADVATGSSRRALRRRRALFRAGATDTRSSASLGAASAETRASRLLQGAGASVTVREVRERSGMGSAVARVLLEMVLDTVRDTEAQRELIVAPAAHALTGKILLS